jgi:peptide/nickel transport system substrate-binding protein
VSVVAVAALALLLVAACGGGGGGDSGEASTATSRPGVAAGLVDEGTPREGGRLVVGLPAETAGWNPATGRWADSGNFAGSTFIESLAVFDDDGNLHPWLAEGWSASEDNRTWTIKLREGIRFHDGTEMTAEALRQGLDLARTDGLAAVQLRDVITDVAVVDTYTVQVRLSFPWAVFDNVFAGPTGMVMAPSMLAAEDYGAREPVGTGPFKFRSWTPDKVLVVDRFDGYWGGPCAQEDVDERTASLCERAGVPLGRRNGPFLDSIEFRPIVDSQQRANALEAGDVDLILTTRAEDVTALQDRFQVVTDYDSEQTFVQLNTTRPPFDNVHARRALAYGTDRDAIREAAAAGQPLRTDTAPFEEGKFWGLPPGETGYPDYDPVRAREELAAYTADTGQPTLRFRLSGIANVDDNAIVQQLQAQWAELGIEASVDSVEQASYIVKIAQGDYEAAYWRNYAYPEPDFNYVFWSKKTAEGPVKVNFTGYWSDATEQALLVGRISPNREDRKEAYDALFRERNEQAVDIWLFNTPYALVADKDVRGLNWFRTVAVGTFLPKPWVGGMWLVAPDASAG